MFAHTPATYEAQIYATGGQTGPMQRAPRNRTPWTAEGIKAARDARANRGGPVASGSGAAHTPAGDSRQAEPIRTGNPTGPPLRDPRRTRKAIDIISHLENTPMMVHSHPTVVQNSCNTWKLWVGL